MPSDHNAPSVVVPGVTPETEPFWMACRENRLALPHCRTCGRFWNPPTSACPFCLSSEFTWDDVSGFGVIYSWVVYHQQYHPAFSTPYNVAIIQLDEGPHLLSNVVDCSLDDLAVDLPVQVAYRRLSQDFTLPVFTLRR